MGGAALSSSDARLRTARGRARGLASERGGAGDKGARRQAVRESAMHDVGLRALLQSEFYHAPAAKHGRGAGQGALLSALTPIATLSARRQAAAERAAHASNTPSDTILQLG
jgi:hypothetical protein